MGADDSSNSRRQPAILLALTLAAGAARLYRLRQSLWYDEIFSLFRFFRSDWLSLVTAMPDPNHHPLYSLLAKLSLGLFGESEWSLRLPAFLLSALTPPLLYAVGRRWWNPRVGWAAALFYCFSFWPVWYGQDARGYSGMILFAWIGQALFLEILKRPRPRLIALYVLSLGFGAYFHLYAAVVGVSHLLLAGLAGAAPRLGFSRRSALAAGGAAALGLGLVLLLYAPMFHDLIHYTRTEGQVTQGRALGLFLFRDLFLQWSAGPDQVGLSLIWLALFLFGLAGLLRRNAFLLGWLFLPLALGILPPLLTGTFVYHRFLSYALPAYFLAVALGLDWVRQKLLAGSGWGFGLVLVLLLATLVPGLLNYYRLGKQPIRETAQWIRHEYPAAPVRVAGLVAEVWGYYDPVFHRLPLGTLIVPEQVSEAIVVVSFPWSVGQANLDFLEQHCGPARIFPAAGYPENAIRVYRCEKLR
jgi:4-amino-4-deoxy-L-arabinose transferase-like glycosyltransferase